MSSSLVTWLVAAVSMYQFVSTPYEVAAEFAVFSFLLKFFSNLFQQ